MEQIVDLDGTDDVYNWPMMYAVEVGHWALPDDQAAQLREFLLRGGFLMVDDFHGDEPYHNVVSEWQVFLASMTKVFPDRPIEDLENSNPIFHTVYDLDDRFQVPGWQWYRSGRTYEAGETGKTPHWRAIYRRQGPRDGRDLPQHGSGRCVGVVGRSAVSGEVGVAGISDRDELFHLRSDALRSASERHPRGLLFGGPAAPPSGVSVTLDLEPRRALS